MKKLLITQSSRPAALPTDEMSINHLAENSLEGYMPVNESEYFSLSKRERNSLVPQRSRLKTKGRQRKLQQKEELLLNEKQSLKQQITELEAKWKEARALLSRLFDNRLQTMSSKCQTLSQLGRKVCLE